MNKRGQLGMGLMMGMIVALIVFVMLSAFLPTIIQMLGMNKGNNAANCPGYIDQYATTALGGGNNNSYNSALDSDTITCSILDFTPGLFVISILFAIISGVITGRLAMSSQEQQPMYQQY
jgi:hypothetical protein